MTLLLNLAIAYACVCVVWNALCAWTLFALWLVARLFNDRGIAVPSAIARYRH